MADTEAGPVERAATAGDSVERESKLLVGDDFDFAVVVPTLPAARRADRPSARLDATYHDTADRRLARAGVSVRFRTTDGGKGEWTVKLPATGSGKSLNRHEIDFEAPGDRRPAEVDRLLRAIVRGAPLEPAVRLVTDRRVVELRDEHDRVLVEVADDRVRVRDSRGRTRLAWRELEVEQRVVGAAGPARKAVSLLRREGGRPSDVSKVSRALGVGIAPLPAIPMQPSLRQVVAAALQASVAQYTRHEPGVRLGEDAEDLHRARVAVRRFRSDLRTFRPVLDACLDDLDETLSTLADALGRVRDADVLLERLQPVVATLPEADRAGAAGLLARIDQVRAEARADLLRVLDDDGYVAFLDRLDALAAGPPCTADADRPAGRALRRLARRPWRRLRRAVRGLDRRPSDADLHRVRILAKRARYAAEAAAPVLGRPTARLARSLAGLQSVLGTVQDTVAAEDRLRALAADAPGPQSYVAGLLVAAQRAERAAARERWRGAWQRADGRAPATFA